MSQPPADPPPEFWRALVESLARQRDAALNQLAHAEANMAVVRARAEAAARTPPEPDGPMEDDDDNDRGSGRIGRSRP